MNNPVLSALVPVVLLIAIGFVAGRAGWIRAESTKDLSNLVFMVLMPALLFRTMSTVHIEQLDFKPLVMYFVAAGILFATLLAWLGITRKAAVLALGATFGNTVMIGVPLVSLAYGQDGLVQLFTLISVHALVLLTLATLIFEWALARERRANAEESGTSAWRSVWVAVRGSIIHPVPLPIIGGLLFAQIGWVLSPLLERPLQLLGNAFGPIALLMVGISLCSAQVGQHFKAALGLSLLKNLVFPLLVAALSWVMGLRGIPLKVMVVVATVPMGTNVFMFSQRYQVAEELVTASMAVSTMLALVTVSLVMVVLGGI